IRNSSRSKTCGSTATISAPLRNSRRAASKTWPSKRYCISIPVLGLPPKINRFSRINQDRLKADCRLRRHIQGDRKCAAPQETAMEMLGDDVHRREDGSIDYDFYCATA